MLYLQKLLRVFQVTYKSDNKKDGVTIIYIGTVFLGMCINREIDRFPLFQHDKSLKLIACGVVHSYIIINRVNI